MKILFDIGHPAHVHLFRNAMGILESRGHELKITARDKDIALELLENYGFNYEVVGKNRKGVLKKALNMLVVDYNLLKVSKRFNPDLIVSAGSPYAAHVSKLIKKPCIAFVDTEHANLTGKLTYPFTDMICTPECFQIDLGQKHIRYNGYHELAYLHPNYFSPDSSVLDELDLNSTDKIIILRFISWEASHDVGQSGLTNKAKLNYVSKLEQYGRVFISSEVPLGEKMEKYRLHISPVNLHSLLSYAHLYIGEGGTMATEAGILGTPSVFVSSLVGTMGNFEELEKSYGLVHSFKDGKSALQYAMELIINDNAKEQWGMLQKEMLNEKIDVTKFMVNTIEDYLCKR